jgi:uncharacterized protein YutE (UPF0331/DUF86 family)
MTSGPIDLKVVQDRLQIVEDCLRGLRALPLATLDVFLSDYRNPAAAESLLRRSLEALLDVARHLLAKGFGQRSLEYRQVAQLSVEKGLIRDAGLGQQFLLIASYRNRLTHVYSEVTPSELYKIASTELGDVEAIATELRQAAARLFRSPA